MSDCVIYKYHVDDNYTDIEMPYGARILRADYHNGGTYIWAMVDIDYIDSSVPHEKRTFCVFGTGQEFDHTGRQLDYINTFYQGPFVWHVFEEVQNG